MDIHMYALAWAGLVTVEQNKQDIAPPKEQKVMMGK
jgi:hypothetical protein